MNTPHRDDDQNSVLEAIGPAVPILLREMVESGFHDFSMSRKLDPSAHSDYTSCTRMNMLNDRIMKIGRGMINDLSSTIPGLGWKITANKRATVVLLDPYFAFRVKREKANRGGLTTGVNTRRRRAILSCRPGMRTLSVGQQVLPFAVPPVDELSRIWLTVSFDLDLIEERVEKVSIGREMRDRFLWKQPIPEAPLDVVATLHPPIAARIMDLRQRRSA